ncbi:hypothetical protein GCM10010156_64820 [Planobispora rosea]|uniref:Uncharacterized protein n=1 Tax=Planobispora rosea TaxID=35762 RepID=A0A8J3S6W9_PLARO|nr:hypothetical protein [Planobispora rosea]GGS97665.1 hypothetical protein GCM10010156_64820 [Planobispora rosea]GIH87840.1 hypothetical protein Pro02_62480 [Planobispora rosea]
MTEPPINLELSSPLTLLMEEERHGDRQAEEALFLSFTTDLGFFETVVLGITQMCGARVSLVGDAAMSVIDPRAVRRAGRVYLPGQAVCDGAFHPKLMVLVGPKRATVAIGSGNVTLAGWQANAELWTVLRADQSHVPGLFGDLATWLSGLPDRVRFSVGVPDALRRVADGLAALQERAEVVHPDLRLMSSSQRPIIEQLPKGPVEELAVCAPFHDPGAVTLRRLVERMRPRQLVVSFQPGRTELDGRALADLVTELDADVRLDAEPRYRHGKLIEWVVEGRRYALTGSPNLSAAALSTSLENGGNCELGLITPIEASRMPAGAIVPPADLHSLKFSIRSRPERRAPLLLGATRTERGLHVMFTRTLRTGGYLELSAATAPPETWERAGEVSAGLTEVLVTQPTDGGSRVRLVTTVDGQVRHSNVVFAVDLPRAQARQGLTRAPAPTTQPGQLFTNERLADKFLADLNTLATSLTRPSTLPAPAAASTTTTGVEGASNLFGGGWTAYLDKCAGRLGTPLLRFALGLPSLAAEQEGTYEEVPPVPWEEQFANDVDAGLDNDDPETVTDQPATVTAPPDLRTRDAATRRRYQRWADRLTRVAPTLELPERMLVTRLLLWTAAAGAWDHDDHAWLDLLADAVGELGADTPPTEVEPQVASLAAVGLAVLRAHAPRHVSTATTVAFTRAAAVVDHLLPAAEPEYIEQYSELLQDAFGPELSPYAIQSLAAEIVQADPLTGALRTLAEQRHKVHRHGERLLHVTGAFGNARLVALQAVAAAQASSLVGAWATSSNGTWSLVMWRRPDLFTIDAGPRTLWRHYRLTGLRDPRSLTAQRSFDGVRPVSHDPLLRPFSEALAVLADLGLPPDPRPPADCSPW